MGTCKSGCFTSKSAYMNHNYNSLSTKTSSNNLISYNYYNQQLIMNNSHVVYDNCFMWSSVLNSIKKQLKRHSGEMAIVGFEVINSLMDRFAKYRLTIHQKNQYLTIISHLIQHNYSTQRLIPSTPYMQSLALRLLHLQQTLLITHKSSLQHFKFLTGHHHQKKHYHLQRFTQLQFTFTKKELQNLVGIVRTFCQEDIKAVGLLSLYFVIGLGRDDGKLGIIQVERMWHKHLQGFLEDYVGGDVGNGVLETTKVRMQQVLVVDQGQEVLVFDKYMGSNLQQVKQLIQLKQKLSFKDISNIEQIIEQLSFSHLPSTKIQFSTKNLPHSSTDHPQSIAQILYNYTDDLSIKQFFKNRSEQFSQKKSQKYNQLIQNIYQSAKQQIKFLLLRLEQYLSQLLMIKLKPIPMFQVRIIFLSLSNLIQAMNTLTQLCKMHNYLITNVSNDLAYLSKSLTITIKLPHSHCQITLFLKQPSISNQFHLNLTEMINPKIYTLPTHLFLLNKQWSLQFFTQLFMKIQSIEHYTRTNHTVHNELRTSQDLGFQGMVYQLREFAQKYLLPNGIDIEAMIKDKLQQESTEMSKRIHKLKHLAKTYKYPSDLRYTYKPIDQKLNQISLLTSIGSIDLAYDMIKRVKINQFQTNRQGVQIYGDVLTQKLLLIESIDLYQKCLKLYQRDNETNTQGYLRVLEKLACNYGLLKNSYQSIKICKQAFKIRQHLSKQNPQIDSSLPLIKIAQLYTSQQQYKKALQCYKQALQIRSSSSGQSSLLYAQVIQAIALTHQLRKHHDKALQHNHKCLEIYRLIHGRQSMPCAQILNRLGSSYLYCANYQQSLAFYQQSLTIRERITGKDTMGCVPSLSSIGSVYVKCCQYKQCLPYFKKCLSIVERTYGRSSIQCVKSLNNLIVVFYHMEKYQEAVLYGKRCLEIQQMLQGIESVDCSGTLFGLSIGYEKLGLGKQALDASNRAWEIRVKQLGEQHQLTLQTWERLKDLQSANMTVFC